MKSVNIYSKRFFIRNFKLTDVTLRYLSWFADKNSIKNIKHNNFNKISQLTKYAKRILKKAKPDFIETKNLVSNNQKNLINPSKWNNL